MIAHGQAAHLPRLVGQAGQTAPGDHARARGRRRRRALDDHVQPRAVHPRPARRALPGGRFRRVRVRPGRLDRDGCHRQSGQASPRDNVVFEAGLFGGALGIRRTFILHANGAKLPTDLLGLTSVRYDPATSPAEVRAINRKLRKAIEAEGRRGPIEGLWWQLSLTARSELEPSAVSLLRISRDRDGGLERERPSLAGGRHAVGPLLERGGEGGRDPAGIFYFWRGERPRHPTPRSSRARARSGWRPPTAPPVTGPRGRIATPR